MINIGHKPIVKRRAVAEGRLQLSRNSAEVILQKALEKGDVFEAAKLAAVRAVKDTPRTVFHCHPIRITKTEFEGKLHGNVFEARVAVEAMDRTGCEMEALNGVLSALANVWDMVKPYEKDLRGQYPRTRIFDVRIVEKTKNPRRE